MRVFYLNVVILLMLLAGSCDTVVESPVPDKFQAFQPKQITLLEDSNGRVEFDLLVPNQPPVSVSIQIGNPKKGMITSLSTIGKYAYQAFPNTYGIDTVPYSMCHEGSCKTANLFFDLGDGPPVCENVLTNDSVSVFLSDTIRIDLLGNDTLNCGFESVSIKNISAGTGFFADGKAILIPPPLFNGLISITYKVCQPNVPCIEASAKVNVTLDCNSYFKAIDDTLRFAPGILFKTFFAADLLANERYCPNTLVPSTFAITQFPTGGMGVLIFQNNRWWYNITDSAGYHSDTFQYKVCNTAGRCDTATVTLLK